MFSFSKTLLLGAASLLFANVATAGDCTNYGLFSEVHPIGSWDTGGRFCETRFEQGVVVAGLEVWANTHGVTGVQFFYSDGGSSPVYGRINQQQNRLDWDAAKDGIASLRVWGNGKGTSVGRIHIRTKNGQTMAIGKDIENGQTHYEMEVGSGVLMGATGSAGHDLDSIAWLFLKGKVERIVVNNVVMKDSMQELNDKKVGIAQFSLDYADHTNNLPIESTYTFSKTHEYLESKRWIGTVTHTFGVSVSIEFEAKVFGIGSKVTGGLEYGYSDARSDEVGYEQMHALTWTTETALAPGERIFCRAQAEKAIYNGKYTAEVTLFTEGGGSFSFKDHGDMTQTKYSDATSSCQNTPFTREVPKRAIDFVA